MEIKQRLLLPFPMRGVERKIYVCVFVLLLLGVFWSLMANSWTYLDKIGSGIIIVGLWITWQDYTKRFGEYHEAKRSELVALIAKYDSNAPKGLIGRAIHQGGIEKLKEGVEDEMSSLTLLMIKRSRYTEAAILIFGTFLNGFGSVIFQSIFPLGNA